MNRKHTSEDYIKLIERIRAARSDIALSGDFIVGFPGETEADFEKVGYDPIAIAKKEFDAGVIPIDVVRPMPQKKIEKEERVKYKNQEEEQPAAK